VDLLGELQVQEGCSDGGVEQSGVERTEESAVFGGALELGIVGPRDDPGRHAVEDLALCGVQSCGIRKR
jgi:hypothetical protein